MGGGMVNTCSMQKTGYNLQKNKDGHHPPLAMATRQRQTAKAVWFWLFCFDLA